jgi:glycerophosphoryl diester phosphodiesterase
VDGRTQAPTDFIMRAHKAKLLVHPYTFRSDKEFLPVSYQGQPDNEYRLFKSLGADGFFTDFPSDAVQALKN